MHTPLSFTVTNLLTIENGKLSGPMSPLLFAKDTAIQLDFKFNRLARVHFHDPAIFQRREDGGYTGFDHLIIACQYSNDLWLSLWIDEGISGLSPACCFQSDRQLTINNIYRTTSYARKLSDEELTALFEYIFTHPETTAIKQ